MKNRKRKSRISSSLMRMNKAVQEPSASLIFIASVLILLLAFVLIGLVWQKILILQIVTEIDDLERQRQRLEENIGKLNSEVLELSNNDRLIRIGREKLGLVNLNVEVLESETIFNESDFQPKVQGKND